ncbi:STAS domain-containing protein [Desulfurispirillum indicum]|uniref:Anti-sigma factor antagonist n=1 Tax=Desulfurispirillum indicum (strain ATCC BAA-1389 / DSM 22839 / S5) TaxID=653733 RepID=E6W113_DESIS|nr:STAS domain-containing protein [Desulfurispirillum indicum]ADU65345.1 anti-anti-sigma factor [Desulfurispirillum indicum S5]UCZ57241.1 STAS domain-containing protein [Desulfurispirillum indicum]
MGFTVEEQDGIIVVCVEGERLDAHNSVELKEYLQKLQEKGPQRVVVDLGRVQFMDSSGIGALVAGFKGLRAAGGDLRLCCIASPVEAIFQLTRLYRVFPIYGGRREALESFRDKETT